MLPQRRQPLRRGSRPRSPLLALCYLNLSHTARFSSSFPSSYCRVYSAQATTISVCGRADLSAPGSWVDFGQRSLALTLAMPPSTPGGGGALGSQTSQADEGAAAAGDSVADVFEFPYAAIAGAHVSLRGGAAALAITFDALPFRPGEIELPKTTAGDYLLRMDFPAVALAGLAREAPRVAAAVSPWVTLPQGGGQADLSQPERPRTVSM